MNRLNAIQAEFNGRTQPYFNFLQRDSVSIVLTLILALYGAKFAPMIVTPQLQQLFDNVPFKLGYLSLVVYLTGISPVMSILLAFAVYVGLSSIRGAKAVETYTRRRR